MTNKEFLILHYENRINKLSINFMENINLINKAKRKLRKVKNNI